MHFLLIAFQIAACIQAEERLGLFVDSTSSKASHICYVLQVATPFQVHCVGAAKVYTCKAFAGKCLLNHAVDSGFCAFVR